MVQEPARASKVRVAMSTQEISRTDLSRTGVVIIGRNEGERLISCLKSVDTGVAAVVYVDSGSTDGSADNARLVGAHVVELDMSVPFSAARARHAGVEALHSIAPSCDFVFFVDGDCEVCEGWALAGLAELVKRDELAAVSGRIIEKHPEASIYNRLMQLEWDRPAGDVDACPGISMMRLEAYHDAGGFDPRVIAGEEPELCLRMRRRGWRIARINCDMVLHDAAIERFQQWWKRCERGGYAASLGASMHGSGPERYNVARVRRALVWGVVLPVIIIGASVVWLPAALMALLYVLQAIRLTIRSRRWAGSWPIAVAAGIAQILDKFPQAIGIVRHRYTAARGHEHTILEYKSGGKRGGAAIAYIAPMLPAASETFVYREIRGLRSRGHRVRAVSLREPGDSHDNAAPDVVPERIIVYRGGARLIFDILRGLASPLRSGRVLGASVRDAIFPGEQLAFSGRLKLFLQAAGGVSLAVRLRRLEPRCVRIHAHFAHAPTSVAMYAAMYLDIPFSWTGHANDLFQRRQLLRTKLKRADGVACISEWHKALYSRELHSAASKYHVIRCGVDTDSWRPITRNGDSGQPMRILSVGRFVEKKGFDLFAEAVARVASETGRVEGIILGDGPERSRIEQTLADRDSIAVVRLPGNADNSDVREAMLNADVFLLPCRQDSKGDRDGLPVVLLEAMACGLPVIVGDLPAIRELVEHGVTGLLIDTTDATAATAAIQLLLNDPELRSAIARAGRERVIAEFSANVNLARLEELFSLPTTIHSGDVSEQKQGTEGVQV